MEESGNFILMIAGVVQAQNNDITWLKPYWPLLKTWADYLNSTLPDPQNQLCTDDFLGPSPHNANLALKGIIGLGAYAWLLSVNGEATESQEFRAAAESFAADWINLATDRDGGHTKLQYNLNDTWSQKYNALYQYILSSGGMKPLFPTTLMDSEVKFYQSVLQLWGLPLDSRGTLSKTDWSSWIAAMSSDQSQFSKQIFQYLYKFAMSSPSKQVPFSDWYDTADGAVLGFRARPVQGGLFAKALLAKK